MASQIVIDSIVYPTVEFTRTPWACNMSFNFYMMQSNRNVPYDIQPVIPTLKTSSLLLEGLIPHVELAAEMGITYLECNNLESGPLAKVIPQTVAGYLRLLIFIQRTPIGHRSSMEVLTVTDHELSTDA